MDYQKIYDNFIKKIQLEQRVKGNLYYERHHILPTFLFKKCRNTHRYNLGKLDLS